MSLGGKKLLLSVDRRNQVGLDRPDCQQLPPTQPISSAMVTFYTLERTIIPTLVYIYKILKL